MNVFDVIIACLSLSRLRWIVMLSLLLACWNGTQQMPHPGLDRPFELARIPPGKDISMVDVAKANSWQITQTTSKEQYAGESWCGHGPCWDWVVNGFDFARAVQTWLHVLQKSALQESSRICWKLTEAAIG